MKIWKTFLSIKELREDKIVVNIPGSNFDSDIEIPLSSISKEFHPLLKTGGKYFVNANIGAVNLDELVVGDFEIAEEPTEEFYKYIAGERK